MKSEQTQHVIVVGAGLSGLTAANQILKKRPQTKVTVLEANDYLGGRTQSRQINGCTFDLGAEFIGPTQHHVIELAFESKNELVAVECKGKKIIAFKEVISTYTSNIPSNVNIIALLQMQLAIMKINRMAHKVPTLNPRDCELGYYWDSITVQSWVNKNISFTKVKVMIQAAVRVILGTELNEVSFLYFLWYIHQSGDFDNIINVQNGLQEKKTALGTQHFSLYLGEQIKKKRGEIKLNYQVKQIIREGKGCKVINKEGQVTEADYMVLAIPPFHVNRIEFTPQLSTQRKLICQKNFMGSLVKVILLYERQYWKEKGFTGQILSDCFDHPAMNGFDDSRINHEGKLQPAIIIFVGGAVYRQWKDRNDLKKVLVQKLATFFNETALLTPIDIQWKAWDDVQSIGGAPVAPFPPGLLSMVGDLRKPEGRIHWAGTQLATVSTGYMDGAIDSGKRVSLEILQRLNNPGFEPQILLPSADKKLNSYTKYNVSPASKFFEWW